MHGGTPVVAWIPPSVRCEIMSKSKIGAIWEIDGVKANDIHLGFYKNSTTFIWISEDGKYWSGTHHNLELVKIGDKIDCNYLTNKTYADGAWNKLRQMMIDGKLGPPTYGEYSVTSETTCVCDISLLMYNGCPSSKGLKCQNKQ